MVITGYYEYVKARNRCYFGLQVEIQHGNGWRLGIVRIDNTRVPVYSTLHV